MDAVAWGTLGAALGAGLLSGVHCASMCGGIAGAHQLAAPVAVVKSRTDFARQVALRALPFNAGRIASYTALGALAGGTAQGFGSLADTAWVNQSLFVAANLLLIMLGTSMATGMRMTAVLESAGGRLWAGVRPVAASLLRSRAPAHGAALGALWGFMPCALVYAMLLAALAGGYAAQGALLLLAFGIGTLPNLLAVSLAWAWPSRNGGMRIFAPETQQRMQLLLALVLIAFGVFGLLRLPAVVKLHGLTALCHPALS